MTKLHHTKRRILGRALSFVALSVAGFSAYAQSAAPVAAQASPTGTLSIVVPYPAGGISDILARTIAPALSKSLNRTVIVENVVGATGTIAANRVLAAQPGNALFVGSPTEILLAPLSMKSAKFKSTDFRLLSLVYSAPLALYARADLPANNVDELLAYAKQPNRAPLNYGSTGIGSLFHVVTESAAHSAGLPLNHVPYGGGAPLLQDLQGGTLDLALFPVDKNLAARVAGGRMKVLGVSSPSRSEIYPNAATFAESKALAKFGNPTIWVGLMLPSAVPDAVTRPIYTALEAVLANPEMRKTLANVASNVPPSMSLEESAKFLAAEDQKFQAMAKLARLEAN